MSSEKTPARPIWFDSATGTVRVIDQRQLPHQLVVMDLDSVDRVIYAIVEMVVRGAPLIGATAAYGVYVACAAAPEAGINENRLCRDAERIKAARPTAVNLAWAVDQVLEKLLTLVPAERKAAALALAAEIADQEAENCRCIGSHGLPLIKEIARAKNSGPVNVLTHCNAGWLACVEYGTATAPIYAAAEAGIDLHVWVDETRPLNQGARLTAWELARRGIAHTVITDNAGGHLMQHGRVDLVIVGTDRTTASGDVANKIGTYLKALAARDNRVPFYVALPSSTFDWDLDDGVAAIPIEERDPDEVRYVQGLAGGRIVRVLVPPAESPAVNFAFDVTPARLVTGFITERGICGASAAEIRRLFPERFACGDEANGPRSFRIGGDFMAKRSPEDGRGAFTDDRMPAMVSELEKRIIASIQDDLPVTERPYREIANRLAITENQLLDVLRDLCARGVIRRFGATLRHQKSGFAANAMGAWQVPEDRIEAVGAVMSASPSVSHCYRRDPNARWPYNLYTMIHAGDHETCRAIAAELSRQSGISDYLLLFSRRELKKTSMQYFSET